MLLEMGLLACMGSCIGLSGLEVAKALKKKEQIDVRMVESTEETMRKENLYKEYPIIYSEGDEEGFQIATNYYIQNNEYYKDAMYLNSMIIGAPGSWKSTVGIYPNLLNKKLRGTLIINDPKGEFYNRTSNIQREFGRKVKKISFKEVGEKINVLRELETEDDVFEFAKTLMINASSFGLGLSQEQITWVNLSATLLTSLFCFVKNYKDKKVDNIAEALLLLQLAEDESELEEILKKDALAYKYFLSYRAGGKSNAKNNILLNITTMLSIFLSDFVREVTDETTVNLNNLRKEEYAIYLCGDEVGSTKMAPVIAPIIQLFLKKSIELGPKPYQNEKEKSEILDIHFLLDEFGNMGRIENLNQYLTMMREYRVNMYIVLQTFSQLNNYYTKSEVGAIMAGIGHVLFLTNNREASTVSKIVEMACSEKKEHVEKHLDRNGELMKISTKYVVDNIITSGEAGSIARGNGILFVGSQNIMKISFNRWFDESKYKEYCNIKPIKPIKSIKKKKSYKVPESVILNNHRKNNKSDIYLNSNLYKINPSMKEVALTTDTKEKNIKCSTKQKIEMEYQNFIDAYFK